MNRLKKVYVGTARLAVLLVTTLFFSCAEDHFTDNKQDDDTQYINFGVSGNAGYSDTRATEQNEKQKFVLRGENEKDTVCVTSTISDGIIGNDSQTRAMPVTELNSFGVLGLVSGGNIASPDYLMYNEEVTKSGNLWTSYNTYYWPGTQYTLKFYAYAPFDCEGLTLPGSGDPANHTLKYTVPDDATNQQDLMVAVTADINGANEPNKKVNLTFSHICTAIQFVVGDDMQPGTIQRITLKNVYGSGDYAMDSQQWNNLGSVKDFTQEPHMSTGGTNPGTGIIYDGTTYMMIPQQLPANAEIEILFADATGNERTLSASIAGTQWPIGKTVTYKLSITPEYTLEFTTDPVIQDAHYIIYEIKINAEDVNGGWTLTSQNEWVTLRTDLTDFQQEGYWIEKDKGETSISGTTTGETTVYAFLWENPSEAPREAILELRPRNNPNATPATFTIEQLCPAWNGTIGCERIEDEQYVWGFRWGDDAKVVYNMGTGVFTPLLHVWVLFLPDYVTSRGVGWFGDDLIITIDYSKISVVNVALSETDGLKNTSELYNYNGVSDASNLEARLERMGGRKTSTGISNPAEFAAKACAMKNKFYVEEIRENGQRIYVARIKDGDLVWYLPAKSEFTDISDSDYPLSGDYDYWTSTAINDSQNAYKYNAGTTSPEPRNNLHNVRAVRKR